LEKERKDQRISPRQQVQERKAPNAGKRRKKEVEGLITAEKKRQE